MPLRAGLESAFWKAIVACPSELATPPNSHHRAAASPPLPVTRVSRPLHARNSPRRAPRSPTAIMSFGGQTPTIVVLREGV